MPEPTTADVLREYGRHLPGCVSLMPVDADRCSCGLAAAIDRLAAEAPAAQPESSAPEGLDVEVVRLRAEHRVFRERVERLVVKLENRASLRREALEQIVAVLNGPGGSIDQAEHIHAIARAALAGTVSER